MAQSLTTCHWKGCGETIPAKTKYCKKHAAEKDRESKRNWYRKKRAALGKTVRERGKVANCPEIPEAPEAEKAPKPEGGKGLKEQVNELLVVNKGNIEGIVVRLLSGEKIEFKKGWLIERN